jgi:signal transduction histidine kinase
MAQSGLYTLVLFFSAALSAGVGVLATRRRTQRGAIALAGLAFSGAAWSTAVLGEVLAADEALAFAFHRGMYLAVAGVALFLFVFALRFGDRRDIVSWRTLVVLLIEPTLFLGFLVTAPDHGMVWTDGTRTALGTFEMVNGPIFWAHVAYSYVLGVAGIAVMLRRAIQARGVELSQFVVVVAALLLPLGTGVVDLAPGFAFEITPVAVSVTGLVLLVAMDRYDLISRAPIVRDVLVESIDDAMLVLDGADELVDYNEAFAELAAVDRPLGRPISDVLDSHPALHQTIADREEGIVRVETAPERYLEVSVSTVRDDTGVIVGDLFLLHDVTEQQRQQHELERQNEQLDRFASLISHDLRNPLDVAIGRTTVVGELTDDPEIEEHVAEIQDANRRMRKIIQDVLTLARQGRSIDDPHEVDIGDLARDAWSHVDTAGATLSVNTDMVVLGDGDRLRQIFENLFRNSVEHGSTADLLGDDDSTEQQPTEGQTGTDDGTGSVSVRVGALADQRGFFVADDGPGIPEDERENVLEAGYSDADGTGLGLAIVDSIAEAHGWDVRITESESGGARFEFSDVEVVADGPPIAKTG